MRIVPVVPRRMRGGLLPSAPEKAVRFRMVSIPVCGHAQKPKRPPHGAQHPTGKALPDGEELRRPWRRKDYYMEGKIRCLKVTRPDTHGDQFNCIVQMNHSLADEFDGAEPGERVCFELCEMTEQEFKDLADFEGW